MSSCVKSEILQAFADRELGARETESVSRHIAGCGTCRGNLERMQAVALKVDSVLDSLAPADSSVAVLAPAIPAAHEGAGSMLGWAAFIGAGALAAVMFLALSITKRPATRGVSVPQAAEKVERRAPGVKTPDETGGFMSELKLRPPKKRLFPAACETGPSVAMACAPAIVTANHAPTQTARQVRRHNGKAQPQMLQFISLDDDPFQAGMIVRVELPASLFATAGAAPLSGDVQADVIVGDDGQPRAIRFVQ